MHNNTPYVAFVDGTNNAYAVTVMKYNGSSWVDVGYSEISAGASSYTSLVVYNGVPYVAFQDRNESDNAVTVMKYE